MGEYKVIDRGATVFGVGYEQILVNGRVKYYPDRDGNLMLGSVETFSRGGFRRKGYEVDRRRVWVSSTLAVHDTSLDVSTYNPLTGQTVTKWGYQYVNDSPDGVKKSYNLDGSAKGRSRARGKLYDLVRCNWDLDCMFTLTFDASRIDRTDYGEIVKALRVWLDNRVRRNGLKYVAVPEYHADGKAVHIHGLCNFDALTTIYSGHRHNGRRVYNISDFPYGFTAVKKIRNGDTDRYAVAAYVCKYISKGNAKVGGRYFLHGGNLVKPTVVLRELSDEDIEQLQAAVPCKSWSIPTPMGTYCKISVQIADSAENVDPKYKREKFTEIGL